jgi:hypothetical protein
MGTKVWGPAPSSAIDTTTTQTRDALVFQVSGSLPGGALAVCMFYYSGNQWVPWTG